MPAFSDQTLKEYLVEFFVAEDMSFVTIESSSFRKLIHLLRPGGCTRILMKLECLKMVYFKSSHTHSITLERI
jgi:hypothetical protein